MGIGNTVSQWLVLLSVFAAAAPDSAPAARTDAPFVKTTHTYKVVGDCRIEADVYRPGGQRPRPGLVWIHGGALIMGGRHGVPQRLLDLCREEGFVLVSIDYRLAPETKLPMIIEDVQDAFGWIRREGPKRFRLDPGRLVVAGGSAGGYLTMMTGFCVRPRPTALVAYWGYGDVDGPWYSRPSKHYRTVVPLISEKEARSGVGGKVLAGTDRNTPGREGRGRYYVWLRQNGLWTKEVTGFDPDTQRKQLDPYCPIRYVTPDYPPILMVHGTEDTDVPYPQSAAMAKELARHGVRHELVTVPNAGHGLGGGDKKEVTEAHDRALAFIRRYLEPDNRTGPDKPPRPG